MPRNGVFVRPKAVSHWAAFNVTPNGDVNKMTRFLTVFQTCCRDSGSSFVQLTGTEKILITLQA